MIGLSIYSGVHLSLSKKLIARLKEKKLIDILVLVGGNIPQGDVKILKDYGVTEVFPVGAKLGEIIEFIKKRVGKRNEKI
ncbi:hypothetical protein ES703_104389 [subsurface metagenome]